MNKSKSIIAIIAMAILATAVAIVSCKKDNENALNTTPQKGYTVQQAADIRQMEDPRSYILDFKKKLTESKDNEAFNLDDAAWHLACMANLDFCNVNVEYDDFQFDTVEIQANVTNGVILLGDLRSVYEQMCMEIQKFKKGFNHYNQNLYYINTHIKADGTTKIALMTSFTSEAKGLFDHTWYFSDFMDAISVCDDIFDIDSTYYWDTLTTQYYEYILNLFEHHDNSIGGQIGQQTYFPSRNHLFTYNNNIDPYGSNFYSNSRIFALRDTHPNPIYDFDWFDLCYLLDSYLGLGYDYISTYSNENPVCWKVNHRNEQQGNTSWYLHYHELYVEYGRLLSINPPGPSN